MNLDDLSKEELIMYIKNINGLIGAVDGKTIEHLRRFIKIYNVTAWQVERYSDLIHFLLDRANEEDRHFVEKKISVIRKMVRDKIKKVRCEMKKCEKCGYIGEFLIGTHWDEIGYCRKEKLICPNCGQIVDGIDVNLEEG